MAVPDDGDELPVPEARAGSSEAWDILFRRFQRPVYAYAFGILHDEQSSLDVVQETFLNAIRHLGSLREDRKFAGWLFGIAHQKCLQACRRAGRDERLQEALSEPAADTEEAPDLRLLREEDTAAFLAAVDSLPAPQRSVLLLHYLEEFPLDVIAGITGVPVGTVKSRLHHAKRSLHRILNRAPSCPPVAG
ncbi:MAG: RNA polymerase sigma factor, partial [Verrucomicrobiae bacterium]|nr:RNA polymerase sigma factor [Verrucomicrobiae bacterium]